MESARSNRPPWFFANPPHYSVSKAALAYGMKALMIPAQPSGEIDYGELRTALRTSGATSAVMVANISSTFTGAYDAPGMMLQAADEAGLGRDRVYLHGDGALGGMILPFLDDVAPRYAISGTFYDSISASGHKMPGCPIPCGVVLAKPEHIDRFSRRIEYLNSVDSTLGGSRSGLAPLLLHRALVERPVSYWKAAVARCMANAALLVRELGARGIRASRNVHSNTVVFPRPADQLVAEWQLACDGTLAHAVVMPNHGESILLEFADALAGSGTLSAQETFPVEGFDQNQHRHEAADLESGHYRHPQL